MKKNMSFGNLWGDRWPRPSEIENYFLAPPDQRWFHNGNDSAGLSAEGLYGTENLKQGAGRVYLDLFLWGDQQLGVLLYYWKRGGDYKDAYFSKGDLSKLRQWTRTTHDDRMSIGLYIPFEMAWLAVKEFIETDGELPKAIEWIAGDDLPSDAFPGP